MVELVAELNVALSMDISATIPFEYPTISLLADYLMGCASDVQRAESAQEPIAIVGLACRFPGAENIDEFWHLLNGDKDAISEVSTARIELTGFRAGNQDAYRWGGFIDDVECFDATLFGISPREARSVDPQQRLLLQTAWHALEHAQIAPDSLSGSNTSVFVGISNNDYFRLQGDSEMGWDAYAGTGSALSVAANRISYLLGLEGPSMAIDTACSSSLVAVHQACRSLAHRESHLALVGGVNLVLSADYGEIFSQANMLSPTGRCHTFDEEADGYVRGEGCGFVVLKRLSDALKDGSQVLAVIKGSAVNQDGRSNGLSAPNGLAQQRVIRAALASAGASGADVDYVETHGTGTPLGDPIEVNALKAVLDVGDGAPSKPCWLGAVKSKIGHLESAAGIASLIKTTLILQHKKIPANLHFNVLNPHIDLDASRLLPATKAVGLPTTTDKPLLASVSSFGFGGTNAHVVLQSHHAATRDLPNTLDNTVPHAALLILSAASEVSLRKLAGRYVESLVEPMDALTFNNEFCASANTSRADLHYRVAVVGTQEEISRGLLSVAKDEATELGNVTRGKVNHPPRVAFLFTGQGSQYTNMGSELYQNYEVYRACIDHCDELLKSDLDCSLKLILYGDNSDLIDETRYAQPALVATEIALFELWKHWGVEAEFVLGHSVGEYSAAYAAGVMDLASVLKLVAERARLMSESHGNGAMLSVSVNLDRAKAHLGNTLLDLDVAAINTPDQVVLSGAKKCVLRAKNIFEAVGVEVTLLKVSHGFHSRLMVSAQAHFASAFEGLELKSPVITMITTGGRIDGIVSDTQYWVAQLCQPVRFSDALNYLIEEGADTFVEIGPAPILTALGRSMSAKGRYLPSLRARVDDIQQMQSSLGELYTIGAATFTKNRAKHATCLLPDLPLYPFEKQRFWFEKSLYNTVNSGVISASAEPCGESLDIASDEFESFSTQLPGASGTFLLEHRLEGESVLPAAAYLELMASAIRKSGWVAEAQSMCIRDINFISHLNLSDEPVMVQTLLVRQEGADSGEIQVRAKSLVDAKWVTCASAKFIESATVESPLLPVTDLSMAEAIDTTEFYAAWRERGLEYGPAFQTLTDLSCANGEVQGKVSLTVDIGIWGKRGVHPTLLDGAFQALGALLYGRDTVDHRVPLPTAIESLQLFETPSTELYVRAKIREEASNSTSVVADLELYDRHGVPVAQVVGLSLTWLDAYALVQPGNHTQAQRFQIEWREEDVPAETGEACAAEWLVFHHQQDASVTLFTEASNNAIVPIALESWAHASQEQLLSALAKAKAISRVVVLINHELLDSTTTVDSISKGLALCQFMQRLMLALDSVTTLDADFRLCLLTRQAESVISAEFRAVAQSGVAGMLRSAALEYPHLPLCQCDIPATLDVTEWKLVYTRLNHSLINALVLREGRFFSPVLMPTERTVDEGTPFEIREKGCYLITGGTGGLGVAVAEWLVDAGAKQLVLVGRRGVLDSERSAKISRLRQRGVEVEIFRADLGCLDEVQTLFAHLAERYYPLRGIIHGAGLVDDQPLANITPDSWQRVVEAKALSAHLLDQSSRSLSLDFFVAFSSISSVMGSAGQCNYAAANAMLDALMAERRNRGESGICINWGPWGKIGMASGADLSARLKRQGITPMEPAEALMNLGQVLTRGDGQTVVADIDWQQFSERSPLSELPALLQELMKSVATASDSPNSAAVLSLPLPETLVLLPEEEALKEILLGLGLLISQVLHINDDAVLQNHERVSALQLSQLGIDSLMAMELRNRIRTWTHAELPAHILIGNNRMSAAAELIHQKMLMRCLSVQSVEHDATADEDTEVFVL
ncbi:MAG: SDR family NAD(P)-dependent oxidoreductase [Thiotrichaceae bacterium]|nr:SDR family NAD(P)-dependent oxidoreductase [Thiotrichaceae bacterium]